MSWKSTYFLPEEVSGHNKRRDCWLIIFGVVKDVTGLVEEYRDNAELIGPIVREAGQDVTYWFVDDCRCHPGEIAVNTENVCNNNNNNTTGVRW